LYYLPIGREKYRIPKGLIYLVDFTIASFFESVIGSCGLSSEDFKPYAYSSEWKNLYVDTIAE